MFNLWTAIASTVVAVALLFMALRASRKQGTAEQRVRQVLEDTKREIETREKSRAEAENATERRDPELERSGAPIVSDNLPDWLRRD